MLMKVAAAADHRATTTDPAARVPITVIVLTLAEADNIGPCLRSVDWADEIVIVDSFSADDTVTRALEARPDARVFRNRFEDFGQQRNWALGNTSPSHEWILFFDADERSNPEFARAVAGAIANPGDAVGFFLCYRNFFLGRWLKRCTLYPTWQLRLLRLGRVRFKKEGHGQREEAEGPTRYLHAPYDHYGFSKGIEHWIARHNRYSTHEVELIRRLAGEPLSVRALVSPDPIRRRRALKRLAAAVPLRPLARFVYLYVIRRGFLDGRAGLIFCLLRVSHEIHILAKLAEHGTSAAH
jgi:glycosyltransferase involved in cell wall biosynthesis